MSLKTRALRSAKAERNRATGEIEEIRARLGSAYRSFDSTTDPDLLEACIFEINALRARYDYALRRAKSRLVR